MDDEHYAINRAWWDERAPAHASSPDYAVQELIADPTRLSDVVRFDLPRLGDINGQRGIHLQCHIGTDTISLHRLGAAMTGLDFSPESIAIARGIAADAGADVAFVQADVYSAPAAVGGGFDFVFTGIGALGWLPDVRRDGQGPSRNYCARVAGSSCVRDIRCCWPSMTSGRTNGCSATRISSSRNRDISTGRNVRRRRSRVQPQPAPGVEPWLGRVITAVLAAGLELTMFVEHDSVPWEALPGRMHRDDGEWRLIEHPERLPLSYTLQAVKR